MGTLVVAGCLLFSVLFSADTLRAQEAEATEPPATEQLQKKFQQMLTGAVLTGQFTVIGKEGPPREEEYRIERVEKIPNRGDYWMFFARIKYGDKDVTVPMPLRVIWAGDTPVVTLTDTTIPGLGTFSSRVVFYNNKYAGTWTHGKVGGHLFGTVGKADGETKPATEKEAEAGTASKSSGDDN
jgi:hypothetical protein